MLQADLESAIEHRVESTSVDYKASFDSGVPAEWVEIVKDVAAFANSGGGVIIFGLADDGAVSAFDCAALEALDPAILTDKIYKYTGQQFNDFSFLRTTKDGRMLFAIAVHAATVPIVFSKPGTYDIGGGKQKTAFSAGTMYFRHGAKSEPANADDLRIFIQDRIEKMRKAWFEGIIKVVEAPPGSQVEIRTPESAGGVPAGQVRLVNDPAAPAFWQPSVDETHPFRQKEVVGEVNRALDGVMTVNSYHIQCVRQVYGIESNPTFAYTMNYSSPRYSWAFVEWILQQYRENPDFFDSAKRTLQAKRN
jgi:hypothetical protein